MITPWEGSQAEKEGLDLLLLPALGGEGNSTIHLMLHKPLVAEAALLSVFAIEINLALLAATAQTKLDFLDLYSTT